MNHDAVPSEISPAKRQVITIFGGPAFRAKEQQTSRKGLGNVVLTNCREYDNIAAHEFRYRQVHEPTNPSTYLPKSRVQPAGHKLARIRPQIIEPPVYKIASVLLQPINHIGAPKMRQFLRRKISVVSPVSGIKKSNQANSLASSRPTSWRFRTLQAHQTTARRSDRVPCG